MLLVTGDFGNKKLKAEMVTADELLAYFKLEKQYEELKQVVVFVADEKYSKPSNMGEARTAELINVQPKFSAKGKNGALLIHYYETVTQRQAPNGVMQDVYAPNRIGLNNGFLHVRKDTNKDLIVFMMLHNRNSESINFEPGTESVFRTVLDIDIAEKAMQFMKLEEEFMKSVMNGNIDEIRKRAQGMGLGNMMGFKENEIRVAVRKAYENRKAQAVLQRTNPDIAGSQFIQSYNSSISSIIGDIMNARTMGIISGYTQSGTGKWIWVYSMPTNAKWHEKKVEVPKGADPEDALQRHLLNSSEEYGAIVAEIEKRNIEATAESKKKTPQKP